MAKILKLTEELEFEQVEVKGNVVSYEELNGAVGGWIERVTFNRELQENGIDVWIDEEGKLKSLTTTVVIESVMTCVEVLAGPLVFTGNKGDGESYALTDYQIECIKNVLSRVALFGEDRKPVRLMRYR